MCFKLTVERDICNTTYGHSAHTSVKAGRNTATSLIKADHLKSGIRCLGLKSPQIKNYKKSFTAEHYHSSHSKFK